MDSTLSMNSNPIAIADAPSSHSLGAFSFDEADEFFWDRKSGRYRYKTGAAKGQFAPREAVLTLTRKNLELRSQELVALGDLVSRGEITTRQFQRQAGELLKRIHLQSAILGSGGVDKMNSADFLRVARTLKTQYYAGKDDETGKRYGLKHLTQELLDGKVSEAQLRARLQMYAQSGNVSYWAAVVKTEQGTRPFGVRQLGAAVHCADCVAYASMRPRPIGELPLPGMNCQCRMNCKCSIVPLTLEQAVARGMTASTAVAAADTWNSSTEKIFQALLAQDNLDLDIPSLGMTYRDAIAKMGQAAADAALSEQLRRVALRKDSIARKAQAKAISDRVKERAVKQVYGKNWTLADISPEQSATLLDDYAALLKKRRKQTDEQSARQKRLKSHQEFVDTLLKTDPQLKALHDKVQSKILAPVPGSAHYDITKQGISLDAVDKSLLDLVYRHEFGHAIDYRLGEESRSATVGNSAFVKDSKLNRKTYRGAIKQVEDYLLRNPRLPYTYVRLIEDLAGALTKNKLGYGHSTEYFNAPGMRQTESFANIFAILSTNDPTLIAAVRQIAPQMTAFVESEINAL